jgi:hypothetical protein
MLSFNKIHHFNWSGHEFQISFTFNIVTHIVMARYVLREWRNTLAQHLTVKQQLRNPADAIPFQAQAIAQACYCACGLHIHLRVSPWSNKHTHPSRHSTMTISPPPLPQGHPKHRPIMSTTNTRLGLIVAFLHVSNCKHLHHILSAETLLFIGLIKNA